MSFALKSAVIAAAALVGAATLAPAEARSRNVGRNLAIAGAVGAGLLIAGAAAARQPAYGGYYGGPDDGYRGYGYTRYGYPGYAEPSYAYPDYGYGYAEAPAYYAPQRRWRGYGAGPNPTAGTTDPARGGR